MTIDLQAHQDPREEIPRLKWLCRRGVKELDIVMTHYLEHSFLDASSVEQQAFRELLTIEDPILFELVVGKSKSDDPEKDKLLTILRNAILNKNNNNL